MVVEATPRALLLEANRVLGGSAHQLGPEDSEDAAVASSRAALADAVVVAEALEETEVLAVAEEVVSEAVVEEASVVDEEALDTSPTGTAVLQMAPPLAPAVQEREVSVAVAGAEAALAEIVAQAVDTATTDEAAVVVGTIAAPAAQTTNPSAAESVPHATAVETVGMAATTAHGSAVTKATATTTAVNEGGIERACARVCHKRLPPFLSPLGSVSMRVRRAISILLTFRGQIPSDQRVSTARQHRKHNHVIPRSLGFFW